MVAAAEEEKEAELKQQNSFYATCIVPSQKYCGAMIEAGYWQFVSLSFTVMALFLDQLRDAFMPRWAYSGIWAYYYYFKL